MSEAVIAVEDPATRTEKGGARSKRNWLRLVVMASVPLLLAAIGAFYWFTSGRWVSTDNAHVQQDKVSVSVEVAGPITQVLVQENQRVSRGDLLFRIDTRPFRIALAQAETQLHAAQVQVTQLETEIQGTGGDIQGARANLDFTERALARQQELLDRGFTTRSRYDEALHAVQEARERLSNAQADALRARSALRQGPDSRQPAIEAALVARERALLDLRRTEVRSPSDGTVTQTQRLQVGNAVVPGLPVVTIVRGDDTWVEANFKETDLARMKVGQTAEIDLDAYPGLKIRGHVDSIGAGTGSQFSLIPAQNASGNWVKVTQRVPVRIAIDTTQEAPMISGLSASVSVDLRERPSQVAKR